MHNLALALNSKGYQVTGSDDHVYEPSRSRLQKAGLLPAEEGWFPEKITEELDAVILGMHAHKDNPELQKSLELGLEVYSYPEFLYQQTKGKKRVVIGGSHGKTSITSMILHVLQHENVEHDYMVGAQLEGFDCMVKLTESAPIAIFEGDEYLSSPIDRRPKFLHYRPHIALISGVAWDHINVFPSFQEYTEQFHLFTQHIGPEGKLISYEKDPQLMNVRAKLRPDIESISYDTFSHRIENGTTILLDGDNEYPCEIFGDHNMQNLSGAQLICAELGVSKESFLKAIQSFKGASNRLEKLMENDLTTVYRDFAHSPSKLKATVAALRKQFPGKKLIACMELHTYSSLNANFLPNYRASLNPADVAVVFYSPKALSIKRLPPVAPFQIKEAFANESIEVFSDPEKLRNFLRVQPLKDSIVVMMSSGNWGGVDVKSALTR